ncbi:MAG: NADH dehydrogenase [Deltaproteobacteria bacterium RIFCSPLOWO2_02_FULL_53_8]|nr:MAG: NADH dehydrogenase [Deltaproteobacteria bacterium RIFCSPLOWO2_02_FULL_53_8]
MIENTLNFPILSLLIVIPLAGAIMLFFFHKEEKEAIRLVALGFTLVNFVVSLLLLFYFDTSTYKMQFVERLDWIPWIGVQYFVGMDGISLILILLTTLTAIIGVLCSWTAVEERVKEFMIHILILEMGMVGVFVALDMILFFLFWEVGLVPMFFLIGIWGGKRKLYANIKFFLYTLFGSVFMLAAIIALYFAHGKATGVYTFDLLKLYEVTYQYDLQWWVFLAFFLGFAIKVPVFPFHTWLPDAHVEAPTAGSVILAAILLKMGTYGFLRFNLPLTLQASYSFAPFIVLLAVVGIIYGAFLAMAQKDIKKLVAYSSVSHLGAVMAGIFAMNQQGIDGGVLQMINHGVSTGGLFLLIGMIYERRHTRNIADFGGLAKVMPVYATLALIIFFSSIGLPGTNGFIGEIMILLGLFKANAMLAVLAATGVILGAAYMLWMYQRVWFGKVTHSENAGLKDLNAREILTLAPFIILIFWIGIFPGHFLKLTSASTAHLTEMIEKNQRDIDYLGGSRSITIRVDGPSAVGAEPAPLAAPEHKPVEPSNAGHGQ